MNVIAVDVGTTSVRLAIISFEGQNFNVVNILASHEKEISHKQDGSMFEQSSEEIWRALCHCNKVCLSQSGLKPSVIRGIAFSATCSLVIHQDESEEYDIIMWMDHRAIHEAQNVTNSDSPVLKQFGGSCSPEFSLSKLLWLKNHAPERLESASGLFELPDWLVYKCIGGQASVCPKSLCCLTCKWGYDAESHRHCEQINSLGQDILGKIGQSILGPGTVSGFLCDEAAIELGLLGSVGDKENTIGSSRIVVGSSLIDAHSGMLAMLSVPLIDIGLKRNIETTFCSLAGTSTCHMTLSREKKFTRGIWGPYKNVVLNDFYLLEAGQSMTGKLIDMCIESHEHGKEMLQNGNRVKDVVRKLNEQILASGADSVQSSLHILPTYHGNRAPLANPRLMGGVYGLTAERKASLMEYYIATIESTVYETKLIVETLQVKLDTILVSGGLMKNTFYMQTLADVLGCQVVKMDLDKVDFMVMGSGFVARQAVLNGMGVLQASEHESHGIALDESSLQNIVYKQLRTQVFKPRKHRSAYHDKKYSCYLKFVEFSQHVDAILNK